MDSLDELEAALNGLAAKWEAHLQEASEQSIKMRAGNTHHAYYYRGVADGYRAALADLRALFGEPAENLALTQAPVEAYTAISRELVLAVLERAGLAISDLHAHADSTFSVILSPLQVLSFDDRIGQLLKAGDIAVLDYGMLPNSSKAYIDFAFRSPPS